jgi:glycosyltransferase involved in cell wall biosynthesis
VSLFVEARFGMDVDGAWAAVERASGGTGWSRYALGTSDLRLVARANRRAGTGSSPLGEGVTLAPLPYYVGMRGLARAWPRVAVAVLREVAGAETVIVRVPGVIGALAAVACRVLRRRYAVEVVGDPVAVLASGALGRAGRLLRPLVGWQMRWVVRGAAAALYVTRSGLQQQYPPGEKVAVTGVSSVRLDDAAFVPRGRGPCREPAHIITVGSQEVPYKGHDVLLRAVERLRAGGSSVTAVIVGDGRLHESLVKLAGELGIDDAVRFTGAIHDRAELISELDRASLFVLPSRTEGLPRALIEAMARALPAVASDVGGISELLEPDYLVPADDVGALADRIAALVRDPVRYEVQSRRNLDVARAYHAAALDARFAEWLAAVPSARASGNGRRRGAAAVTTSRAREWRVPRTGHG